MSSIINLGKFAINKILLIKRTFYIKYIGNGVFTTPEYNKYFK